MKYPLDFEKELQSRGNYKETGLCYGEPYGEVERLSPPISPAENLRLYYQHKPYAWVPNIGGDAINVTPECNPDEVAWGWQGGYDAFGVKWIPNDSLPELPSFVEPGYIVLRDIADWRNMKWQDPDNWDWAGSAAEFNEVHKDDDRLRRGILFSGYFERLISIMSFEKAALVLLEDPDSVQEFFAELTKFNKKIVDHYIDDLHCEAIMIHDDWSAQRSPFFSLDTVREIIVPYMKELCDYTHQRGAFFTLHSCGNGHMLVPAIKEVGADAWEVQINALKDIAETQDACGDDVIIEMYPEIPEGIFRRRSGGLSP